jgi:hypothetical protein
MSRIAWDDGNRSEQAMDGWMKSYVIKTWLDLHLPLTYYLLRSIHVNGPFLLNLIVSTFLFATLTNNITDTLRSSLNAFATSSKT